MSQANPLSQIECEVQAMRAWRSLVELARNATLNEVPSDVVIRLCSVVADSMYRGDKDPDDW